MSDALNIGNEMAKLDVKDRGFYDSLDEEDRKKFAPFIMIRWASSVTGSNDLQSYYVMSVNERLNRGFFEVPASQHKKLLWLLCTTVSPGMGKHRHEWISGPGKIKTNSKAEKFLAAVYPELKNDEIKLLAKINDRNDLADLARSHGWDEKRIKAEL